MAIMLPVMLMLLFTFVFGGAIDPSGGYVDYVVPGIILLCAGFGAASTAVYVAGDMKAGIIDRFRTMPLRASAVLTGHVVASLLRNLLATGVVIGVALLVGFRPTAGVWGWLGAIGIIALYILAITYLFAAIGLAAKSPEGASGYGFIILFVPYLSSAFVPVETMPDVAAVDRREPAGHADHRDDPVAADGHADGRCRLGRDRLVRRHPRRVVRVGRVAVPPQGGRALGPADGQRREASSGARDGVLRGCRGPADDLGGVRRGVGQRRDRGEVVVASRRRGTGRASRRPRRAERTTGCSSGAGPPRAPRRGARRAAP